jgi:hypothetical protein
VKYFHEQLVKRHRHLAADPAAAPPPPLRQSERAVHDYPDGRLAIFDGPGRLASFDPAGKPMHDSLAA